jgi:molecular chaperone GrpE
MPADQDNELQDDSAATERQPGDDSIELDKLRQERHQLYDRLARAQAEFQNSRRRLETEMEGRLQFANSALIKSLLPVIDNFERALAMDPAKADPSVLVKGMQIVHDQWLKVLAAQSVEEIAPEPGTPFDPTRHEALIQQPSNEYKESVVTQLMQKGYMLHGRTLRPAQVAVSKPA